MAPFVDTLRAEAAPQLKDFPKVKADDRHNIQTHVAYLELLVRRRRRRRREASGAAGRGLTSVLCFREKPSGARSTSPTVSCRPRPPPPPS